MILSSKNVDDIYQDLDMGMIVYVHRVTKEIVSTLDFDNPYADDQRELWQDTIDKIESDKENYIQIEKMNSNEAYGVMESFVAEVVSDPKMQGRLEQALEGRKPFANFKNALGHDMDVRDQWFAYKNEKYYDYVVRELNQI